MREGFIRSIQVAYTSQELSGVALRIAQDTLGIGNQNGSFSINEISDTSKGGDTDIQHCLLCSSHRHIPVRSYISPNDKKLDAAGEVKSNAELKILTGPHL